MKQETSTKHGALPSSPIKAVAIEGPSWAGRSALHSFVAKKIHEQDGWPSLTIPEMPSNSLEDITTLWHMLNGSPTRNIVVENHILSLLVLTAEAGQKVDMKKVSEAEAVSGFLFVVVLPNKSAVEERAKTTGICEQDVQRYLRRYQRITKETGLNSVFVESERVGGSPKWKIKSWLLIKKIMRVKRILREDTW